MSDSYQNMDYQYVTTTPAERNRVLRNTYWLLALSMVPTVLGAWLGVVTGLSRAMSGAVGGQKRRGVGGFSRTQKPLCGRHAGLPGAPAPRQCFVAAAA